MDTYNVGEEKENENKDRSHADQGTCYIYACAENGIFKRVKVTVK